MTSEYEWYKAHGYAGALPDVREQWVNDRGYDDIYYWLGSLGYNGAINDRLRQWYADGGYSGGVSDMARQLYADAPSLGLNFKTGVAAINGVLSNITDKVTFTRASTRTYFGSDGLLKTASVDEWPLEYDPVTLEPLGRSVWEARTNLILNSAAPSTQNITTTAAPRTLSFYGTGTVTLSGTHSATVNGSGAFPTRTTYTYTPTAGSLTVTISGDVQYMNDELGSFATPWIETSGVVATRAADIAVMTGTNFSDWYNQSEGTFKVDTYHDVVGKSTGTMSMSVSDNTLSNYMYPALRVNTSNGITRSLAVLSGGVVQATLAQADVSTFGFHSTVIAYKANDFAGSVDGNAVVTDTSGTVPTVDRLIIGGMPTSQGFNWNGFIRSIAFYPRRLSNTQLQALSS